MMAIDEMIKYLVEKCSKMSEILGAREMHALTPVQPVVGLADKMIKYLVEKCSEMSKISWC